MLQLAAKKLALYEVGGDETLLETPYGVKQITDRRYVEQCQEIIDNMESYMKDFVFRDPKYAAVKKTCKNRHSECAFWKHAGECEKVSRIGERYTIQWHDFLTFPQSRIWIGCIKTVLQRARLVICWTTTIVAPST